MKSFLKRKKRKINNISTIKLKGEKKKMLNPMLTSRKKHRTKGIVFLKRKHKREIDCTQYQAININKRRIKVKINRPMLVDTKDIMPKILMRELKR